MFGKGIGSLQVYKVTEENGVTTEDLIWSQENDRGRSWFPAFIQINSSTVFQVKFVAIRGSNWQSDIALDDITFGKCTNVQLGKLYILVFDF